MKQQQSGFTLIELIMVIVILGILAAFALPRFADLGGDAREASINGLAASLKSAAAIAHSAQLAGGGALGATVALEGANVLMVNGYPRATAAGIQEAAGVSTNDYTGIGGGNGGGATRTFRLANNPSATCQVTYTAATAAVANTAPITATPVVTATTNGC